MNEDKVREAISILEDAGYSPAQKVVVLLKQSIAPDQAEIPDGCPVLVWNVEGEKYSGFYYGYSKDECGYLICGDDELWNNIEIDYQRKGAVIPWDGGECPIEDSSQVVYYRRDGGTGATSEGHVSWDHGFGDSDIIAYVITPNWISK